MPAWKSSPERSPRRISRLSGIKRRSRALSPKWSRSERPSFSLIRSLLSVVVLMGSPCEIWWSPSHPFQSGLTGQSAKELCDSYEHLTGRTWTQTIGFQHALFEVAIDVLTRTKNLNEPASILEAIMATYYHSVVEPIQWSGKPVKNVSKTPLVACQWRKRGNGFELVICEDTTAPNIRAQDKQRLLS